MKLWKSVLLLFFFLLFLLPILALRSDRLKAFSLAGVSEVTEVPPLSITSFWHGTFQAKVEDWLVENFPLRSIVVKAANSWSIEYFKETLPKPGGNSIVLGRDKYLFEKSYVNNLNNVSEARKDIPLRYPGDIEESGRRLGQAAKIFKKKNINFVMLFYPHKAWILPEFLDPKWIIKGAPAETARRYYYLLEVLKKNNVSVVDGPGIFLKLKKEHPEVMLFNHAGTHWTHLGACFFLREMLTVMRQQSLRELPDISCSSNEGMRGEGVYFDLAAVINTWDMNPYIETVPKVKAQLLGPLPTEKITALMVKTSFSEQLRSLLTDLNYADVATHFPYYQHSDSSKINWGTDIFSKQWIIFEQSQWSYVTKNTMDFLSDLEVNSAEYKKALIDLNQ